MRTAWIYAFLLLLFSCKEEKATNRLPFPDADTSNFTVSEAQGFKIEQQGDLTILEVNSPWPGAEKKYRYACIPQEKAAYISLNKDEYDAILLTPLTSLVVTSTTHIPSLEMLGEETTLVGFPNTNYVSSEKTRARIDAGRVKEVGQNEQLNTEILINLQPQALVGFAIDGTNKAYQSLQKAGIPVLYNGDWTEQTPLGRAEWIKFFSVLFQKETEADSIYESIKAEYERVKLLVMPTEARPTVLSGAMYKDVWYLPAGESYQATFSKDAAAQYLWADSKGTGSLSLSIENVLEKGAQADFWIAPGQFTSYTQLEEASVHYQKFKPFKDRKVYTFNTKTGATGGTLYYELGPNRPDIILKDLIKIMHPQILPEYQPFFFQPLAD